MPIQAFQYNFKENELCVLARFEDFSAGSIITVQPGQEVIFVKDGVMVDETFLPGRHVLDDTILDSVALMDRQHLGKSTYHAKAYYVNVGRDLSMGWGTSGSGFFIEDPETGYKVQVGANGNYSLAVDDAKQFLMKTVGQMSESEYNVFTKFNLQSFIKAKFQELVKSVLSQKIREDHIPALDFVSHLEEISEKCRQKLFDNSI